MTGERSSRRRLLGAGLVAYGAIGVLLFVLGVAFILGPVASLGRVADERSGMVHWLDLTGQSLDHVGRGAANAAASLASAAAAARDAASLAAELSASMASLRDVSRVSILGSRPLGGLTDSFDRVAARAGELASSMASLARSLDRETTDLATMPGDAAALRTQVSSVRDALAAPGFADVETAAAWLVPVALLLIAWLTTPAVASLVAGFWILRTPGRRSSAQGAR